MAAPVIYDVLATAVLRRKPVTLMPTVIGAGTRTAVRARSSAVRSVPVVLHILAPRAAMRVAVVAWLRRNRGGRSYSQ